jgi:APA family basic amino acid/polyamine antiporter
MLWNQLFATKSLETLQAEVHGDNRLRRVLGPTTLTAAGIGAIIGSGIFVMTGRVAAQDAGPAIVLSFVVAGIGCLFAALCYAEFASMAPVAGSAYTYAYATLGELLAWIIGWDLILEYAMACACVASSWSKYLNEFLLFFGMQVPAFLSSDPFTTEGAWLNLPALVITLLVTVILVIGIRESATANAILVAVKVGVVLFVIVAGVVVLLNMRSAGEAANWKEVPVQDRLLPEETLIPSVVKKHVEQQGLKGDEARNKAADWKKQALAAYKQDHRKKVADELHRQGKLTAEKAKEMSDQADKEYGPELPQTDDDKKQVATILAQAREEAPSKATEKWGILGLFGLNQKLEAIDDSVRSPFMPYGLAGIIFGASIVFFAYIGFDAISTQSEEAKRPSRDVPIAILASLVICTVLYIGVSSVMTGMVPYPEISSEAGVAAAFRQKAVGNPNLGFLNWAALLIAIGAIAGMTSVLMITFLSQARIFLAMSRDRLLPPSIFAAVHPRFRTPHRSTMLTGGIIALVAAFTPITKLEEMVNIGTLMAFVIVCAAVMMLRVRRPNAERPFRCPMLFVFGPLGIVVNLIMMLFLPLDTWIRLVVWLAVGLLIYFGYGRVHSTVGKQLRGLIPSFAGGAVDGLAEKSPRLVSPEAIQPDQKHIHEKN